MTETNLRVLKTATCKSTSGKSTLTYQLGVDSKSALHVRIQKNSRTGYFSREWLSVQDIRKVLDKAKPGECLRHLLG